MQLLVVTLDDSEEFLKTLSRLKEDGLNGIVIPTTSLKHALMHSTVDAAPIFGSISKLVTQDYECNHTLLMLVDEEKLEDAMFLIEDAKNAMEELGIVPKINPIRGGTDGARLSYMGVPCPNICTGGHNYHGRYEYCCIQSMEKITELLIKLAKRGE